MTYTTPQDSQPTAPAAPAGENGGKPGDALSAFLTALHEPPPHDAIADLVGPAFSLGWYVRALTRADDAAVGFAVGDGFTGLAPGESIAFCVRHVQVGVRRLAKAVADSGQDPLGTGALPGGHDPARVTSADDLDRAALSTLSAVDARLGRAYRLGGQLVDLTAAQSHADDATLADQLATERVAPVVAALDDLATAFPPHAGHAVRDSLREWTSTFAGDRPAPALQKTTGQSDPDRWARLRRQGQLWRALLSGEKAGKDMLETTDYLDAAREAGNAVRTIGRRVVREFAVLVGLVVLLFVAGIALVVVLNDGAGAAAGLGAILASVGLTWKGVGGVLGRLARRLEEPLWGAEMDRAITRAITLIRPQAEGARDASRERRHLADALPGRPPVP